MDIAELFNEYTAGRVRHIKPVPGGTLDSYYIAIEILCRRADDSGDFWRADTVKEEGQIIWFKSGHDAIATIANAGLEDAYAQRFNHLPEDGFSILRW